MLILAASITLSLNLTGCAEPEGTEPTLAQSVTSDPLGSLLVLASDSTTPELPMAMIEAGVEVTVTIVPAHTGDISFSDRTLEATLVPEDGYIVVPPITGGGGSDEASLEFRHGDTLLGSVAIHVVPNADIQAAQALLEQHPGAIVASANGFAFIDEQAIGDDALNVDPVMQAFSEDTSRGLCIETPFGAGQVHWLMSNPKSYGYSIDNEAAPSSLRWASGGTEAVDAVYRTSWGCTKALKIPNSCTANVGTSTVECCCNGLFYLLGYQCKYINPSQDPYFTDCPL